MSEFTGSSTKVLDVGRLLRWLPPIEDEAAQSPAPEPSVEEEVPAPEEVPPELILLPPPPPTVETPPPPTVETPPTSEEREPIRCEVGPWLSWSGECYDDGGACRIGEFQFRARQIVQLPGPGASCPHIQEGRVCPCTVEARRDEARAFRFRDLWMFARGV